MKLFEIIRSAFKSSDKGEVSYCGSDGPSAIISEQRDPVAEFYSLVPIVNGENVFTWHANFMREFYDLDKVRSGKKTLNNNPDFMSEFYGLSSVRTDSNTLNDDPDFMKDIYGPR